MEILGLFTSSWGSNLGDAYFPNQYEFNNWVLILENLQKGVVEPHKCSFIDIGRLLDLQYNDS